MALSYPTGPEPVCKALDDGDGVGSLGRLVDPACPRIASLGAPLLLPIYVITIGAPVLALLFAAHRRTGGAIAPIAADGGLDVLAYRDSWLGLVGLAAMVLFHLQWLYLYAIIVADNYFSCQFTGVNNL